MDNILAVAIFLALASLAYSGSPCPKAAEIIPCKCSKLGSQTIIECSYPDNGLLKAALQSMSKRKMIVNHIYINNSRLVELDSTFFYQVAVRQMSFNANMLNAISKDAFSGQANSLEILNIERSSLVQLPIESIEGLLYLNKLQIIKSEITGIKDKAFDNMKSASSLNHLDLSFNYIRFVGSGAFSALTDLRQLRLAGNRIRSLPEKFLPLSNSIKQFSIQNNQLQSLSDQVEQFPTNSELNFADNQISTISGKILKTMITRSFEVDLTGNPLECSCDFRILTIFDDMNSIEGVCQQPSELFNKTLVDLQANDFNNCYSKK